MTNPELNRDHRFETMSLAAFAAVALASIPGIAGLGPSVSLLLTAPVALWLPGAFLLRLCRAPALPAVMRLAAEMTTSIGVIALLLECYGYFGVPAIALVPTLRGTGLAAAFILLQLPRLDRKPLRATDAIIATLALVFVCISLYRGSTVGPGTDTGTHLAILSRVTETGLPVRESPFLAEAVPWRYADAWHRILVGLTDAQPTADEICATWHTAGAIASVAGILGFGLFAGALLSPTMTVIAVIAYAGTIPIDHLSFPSAIGQALLWGGLGLALTANAGSRRLALLPFAVIVAGLAALHPVESYLLVGALLAIGLHESCRGDGDQSARPLLTRGLLAIVVALPIIVAGNIELIDQVVTDQHLDPSFEFRKLAHATYIVDPRFWQIDLGSVSTWLAILCLPLAVRKETGRAGRVALALALVAVLGLLSPPLAWIVLRLGLPSFLLSRIGILMPLALLIAIGVDSIQRRGLLEAISRRTKFALAALLIPALLWQCLGTTMTTSPRQDATQHPLLNDPAKRLLASIPRGSVVLTDPWSSDFLPAHSHYAVAGLTWHTTSTRDQLATWDFFRRPSQSSSETLDILERRNVDYLLLTSWQGHALDWPGYGSLYRNEETDRFVAANPDRFIAAGATDDIALFRIARESGSQPLARKDMPLRAAPEVDSSSRVLGHLGEYDVIRLDVGADQTVVTLRARHATRRSPLVAALRVPAGFSETSALARVVRVLNREPLDYATGRTADTIRIDDRFYTPEPVADGALIEVELPLGHRPGTEVWVGPAKAVPDFPLPLSPALTSSFILAPVELP